MATGLMNTVRLLFYFTLFCVFEFNNGQVLTPSYFNLAQGRNITATATCGVGVANPELFCRLTGSTGTGRRNGPSGDLNRGLIRGQSCDYCYPPNPRQDHRPEYATDGTERWWQSPPLSRSFDLNEVNVTINLGQEFHVAYLFIKMANSPRPGVWVLEKSTDYGKSWEPWQYFADTPSDCVNIFNTSADLDLVRDDQILCTTEFSKPVPLTDGEIVVSLLNERPNAHNFTHSIALQKYTKATDVQLRLLRTKTLNGHLMAVARQDPTVTRRYFYSIKDISIGGRCVCNGHAQTCDTRDPTTTRLLCDCQHNTCGEQCDTCCPGFVQKRWSRAIADLPFICEPCECYGHSDECVFDDDVERNRTSIDIHGIYEGGGVCQNCRDNTMGINCEQCTFGFFRPHGVPRNATDACRPCQCDLRVSTGECEEGSGRCLCRPEYAGADCDRCNFGYYGYPDCIPCECDVNGTEGAVCYVGSGACPCKSNYDGHKCDMCALGFYNFPECRPCECNLVGSPKSVCHLETGDCECDANFGGRDCSECSNGYFRFPKCEFCDCDPSGTVDEICDKESGVCMCQENYAGPRCDRCAPGYYNFPTCQKCECAEPGSMSDICREDGQCRCALNFGGRACNHCAPGYYKYPTCSPCNCDGYGSLGRTCDQVTGQCRCRNNFVGVMCNECGENFYNYPMCEVCNCNPDGAKELPGYPLGGCGLVTTGMLCECKENVVGRICDTCLPGYWNLNRNNPQGCEECECHKPGTVSGLNRCDMETGQCVCKPSVGGKDCDRCLDGFYNLNEDNPFGCINCNCDPGGSVSLTCNKMTGRCACKPRVTGRRCDQTKSNSFTPSLHQYKYEVEDGTTPEGARIKYGFDERFFPDFSWRGYAILTPLQPEVQLDVDIRIPSLYQIIYRFVNREDGTAKGTVTLKPDAPTDITQTGEITFVPSIDPKFAKVTSEGVSSFVLNPGRWTISLNVPNNMFLDYFVLIPQTYYEASEIQLKVTQPCKDSNDPGPCIAFKYPDIEGFPTSLGSDAYVIDGDKKVGAKQHPNGNLTDDLDSEGLAHLNMDQKSFQMDLRVPEGGDYLIVVSYHNPKDSSQFLDVDVVTHDDTVAAHITLDSCPYSSLCRQVLKDEYGLEAIFNISTGYATLHFTGGEDLDLAIDAVYGIPINSWSSDYILPRIICIKINGYCVPSTYGRPVGGIRIDFEQDGNKDLQATVLPPNILDTGVGLVNLNDTLKHVTEIECPIVESNETTDCVTKVVSTYAVPLELRGQVGKPGQYVLMVHYYMPTEVGLNIPVTVYTNGKTFQGVFKPVFCPNNVGCRNTIKFGPTEGNAVSLSEGEVRIAFNGTGGGQIWLDYLLIVPFDQYDKSNLELLPVDKSGDFLDMCVDEGFQLKSDDEFCKQGSFTLTTNHNNGAIDCQCNVEGSTGFNCDGAGGQCPCKVNVIGRTCSACAPNHYDYPNCKRCNCPWGLCEERTGKCICPPRVTGGKCEKCEPGAYGYDHLIGCQACNCDYEGVKDGNYNCDQNTGECECKDNVGGRRCDTCLAGHHSFPYCYDCGCDTQGTQEEICDQRTSQCLCKDNVIGEKCDMCADGMYNLEMSNPKGCTKCFCFGHTTRCESSTLYWDAVEDMTGWVALTIGNTTVREYGDTIILALDDESEIEEDILYWFAPMAYLGKKINSYGGLLSFTVLFSLPRDKPSEGVIFPDIILTGSNMTVVHYHHSQPRPNLDFQMEVPLTEHHFRHKDTNAPVYKDQFMMILFDMKALLIRGSYHSQIGEMRLSNVLMETAVVEVPSDNPDYFARSVEKCDCPPNYSGLSCEDCSSGYYRARTSPYLGINRCEKCNCHGHSDQCNVDTGECYNCTDNTTGPHCEQCIVGYYGDPMSGGACQICSCPLNVHSNNFATTCDVSPDGFTTSCSCLPGYAGDLCEVCDAGYYGDPMALGGYCQPCSCNGNIDTTNPNSCNRITGECQICEHHTGGPNCGQCSDWFWGDAVDRKDCQACSCDTCGSELCDKPTGGCQCKPNVIGPNCDECAPYTWGFMSCTGCSDCECGEGSLTPQCDVITGVCECQPGVEGEKCDRCQAGHWNYGSSGCQKCNCLSDGAIGCDPVTGQCECLPGVTGSMCDRCLPRWVLVPNRGCQECDYCIHILIDDLDGLQRDVTVVSRELLSVSVGLGAFNKLDTFNNTVYMLRPEVDDLAETLSLIQTDDFKANMSARIEEKNSYEKDAINKAAQSENIMKKAELLPENIENVNKMTDEITEKIDMLKILGKETLMHIQNVRKNILESSENQNLDQFITRAQQILNEIYERSFESNTNLTSEEYELAKQALEDSLTMEMLSEAYINNTFGIGETVSDISSKLSDQMNSSRAAQMIAKDAQGRMQRLNAVEIESLARNKNQFMSMNEERTELLKDSTEMIEEANAEVEEAENSVQDVGRESSKMEEALDKLEDHLYSRFVRLDNMVDQVNSSQIHSQEMVKLANDLDKAYENSRNVSEGAVLAGQAYQNILNAIDVARDSADTALVDADVARNESYGVEGNVTMTLKYSKDLKMEAEELYGRSNDLISKKDKAVMEVEEAKANNKKVLDQITSMEIYEENLKKTRPEGVDELMDQVKEAEMNTSKTLAIVTPIEANMEDFDYKQNFIVTQLPENSNNIKEIEDNAAYGELNRPGIQGQLDSLTIRADKIQEKTATMNVNVKSLKDKINRARAEANRIRVGLKFLGNTSVTLRNPAKLEDTGSYTKVSMFLKTSQPDGLLMYVGKNHHTGTDEFTKESSPLMARQDPLMRGDYLALEVNQGKVLFTFDLGTGPAKIMSERMVNDGKWHQIEAERIGKTGTLLVSSQDKDNDIQEGVSDGTAAVLELKKMSTMFLVGGTQEHTKIHEGLGPQQMFVGAIEDLKFDGDHMGLWNFVSMDNVNKGEKQRDFKKNVITKGFRFNGMGYVKVSKSTVQTKAGENRLELSFKTFAANGLIYWMGEQNKDYLSVEITNGKINVQYDLGGGAASQSSKFIYNDGEWHFISLHRKQRKARLVLKHTIGQETFDFESPGKMNNLESDDDIYFGGIDNILLVKSSVQTAGFDGCLKDVNLGSLGVDLFENIKAVGFVKGCVPKVNRLVTFPSTKVGYMGLSAVNIGAMFDVTFKMRTKSKSALLMFVSDEDQVNVFSVSVFNGHIEVVEGVGSQISNLTSKSGGYSDGEWHYISIMKAGSRLSMNIDDIEMLQTTNASKQLDTTSELFFGGLPPNVKISSKIVRVTEGLAGCIGDITINKEFKNLAKLSKKGGIMMAKCDVDSKPPEVKEVITPASIPVIPGQCALPLIASDITNPEDVETGTRFGAVPHSREEFNTLPVSIKIRPAIVQLSFKTMDPNGVLFYKSDKGHNDFLGLFMEDGLLKLGFNMGSGTGHVTSLKTYNDGKWHTVKFTRSRKTGTLDVDGIRVGSGQSRGTTRTLNTIYPLYIGGLPTEVESKARKNLKEGRRGFVGCIDKITLNQKSLENPVPHSVQPCFKQAEDGVFIGSGGGRVQIYDQTRVGINYDISMEIKPRTQDGVLAAVHSKGDYLLLQMSDGKIIFSVENGAGEIEQTFEPELKTSLCDGQWHTIKASKMKHKVQITVDGKTAGEPVEGNNVVTSADTNDPLYIGGVADQTAKGLKNNGDFVGCMRNIIINNVRVYPGAGVPSGDINLQSCPAS